MKKIVFLAAALMASMFILTSCEKENVAEMVENNATEEVKACNYVLVKENVRDEYGNIGNLYEDQTYPNNPYKTYFEVTTMSRSNSRPFTGTWKLYTFNGIPQYYSCEGDATNCWRDTNTTPHGTEPVRIKMTKKEYQNFINKK